MITDINEYRAKKQKSMEEDIDARIREDWKRIGEELGMGEATLADLLTEYDHDGIS